MLSNLTYTNTAFQQDYNCELLTTSIVHCSTLWINNIYVAECLCYKKKLKNHTIINVQKTQLHPTYTIRTEKEHYI